MKAVILAAGEGQRLEPITHYRPKPMVPIANQPLLEYVVNAVSEAGIDEIILVVGYKRQRIQSYFENGDDWGVEIEYAIQEKQLGTGHAILQAEGLIDDQFLVLNGDRIIDASLVGQFRSLDSTDSVHMAVKRVDDPERYGVVDTEDEVVRDITEKPLEGTATSDLINAGVYRFGTDVFEAIRNTDRSATGELAITDTLQSYIDDNRLGAIRYDGRWLDVTHLWDIVAVNGAILDSEGPWTHETATIDDQAFVSEAHIVGKASTVEPNASVLRGTSIGENVRIGANAVIENSVVFSDVTIHPGAVVRDSVIAENVTIGPNTTIEGGDATVVVNDQVHSDVSLGGVVGDNTLVGGRVGITPGTILGDDATVQSGATLSGDIPSGADVRRG